MPTSLRPAPRLLTVCLLALLTWVWQSAARAEGDLTTPRSAASPKAGSASAVDQTIAQWTSATTRRPHDAKAWVALGNAFMQKSRQADPQRNYDRAEQAFRHAVGLDAEDAEATVGLAWVCNSRHQFDQGIAWANKTLALNPRSQDAYALLGDAATELGDYEQALEHYQKCLDLGANLASYSRAAHLLYLTGDASQGRWLMQRAIDSGGPYPENTAWCRAQLAQMLLGTGALPAAQQTLQEALSETPRDRHLLAGMAKVRLAQNDFEAAIEFAERALAITVEHDMLVLLGDAFLLSGQQEQAEAVFERVVALHTDAHLHEHEDGTVHRHVSEHGNAQLARFYADHDRHLEEAVCEAEEAYEHYKNVFVIDTLAWCYYKVGRYEEARKLIREALRWKTPDASILFHAGMIEAKLRARPTAQKYLYQALSLNPNFHPSHARLAEATIKELAKQPLAEGQ